MLQSPEWIERNGLRVGEWFSFELTEIDIESLPDAAPVYNIDAAFFGKIKPDDMNNPHLHHILQKLTGSKELADEILQVQKTLWTEYKIDPFVSVDILAWAPNKAGQHGKVPMRSVIDELNKAFKAGKNRDDIIRLLRSLGTIAAKK